MARFMVKHGAVGAGNVHATWEGATVEVARLCPGAVEPGRGLIRPARIGESTATFYTRNGNPVWIERQRGGRA